MDQSFSSVYRDSDYPEHPMRMTFDFSQIADNFPNKSFIQRLCNQASQFFNKSLLVKRSVHDLNEFPGVEGTYCGSKLMQKPTQGNQGILDSDIHIYVNTFSNQLNNALATSGVCVLGPVQKRPSFAYLNINTFHFKNIGDRGKEKDYEDYFYGIVHELFHVLGFSQSLFPHFPYKLTTENIIIRGQPTTWVTSFRVKQFSQDHFNCTGAIGLQLENFNGDNNQNQHWERVLLNQELMTGNYIKLKTIVSKFTWALLEDSGWYTPTYFFVEDIDWGKNKGCEFFESCDTNKFEEFRSIQSFEVDFQVYECNFYHTSMTRSSTSEETQGKCYIGDEIYDCSNPSTQMPLDFLTLNSYTYQSKCFYSDIIKMGLGQYITQDQIDQFKHYNTRCYQYECTASGIDVIIDNKKYSLNKNDEKIFISPNGDPTIQVDGFIQAPSNIDAFCNRFPVSCLNSCSRNGYCYGRTCHCDQDYAGEDCSIYCPDGQYAYQGACLNKKYCPEGNLFNSQTKECYNGQPCPDGEVKFGHNCVSKCPRTYFQAGLSCIPCMPGCDQCMTQSYCDVCSEGKIHDYYHKTCVKCWKGCLECHYSSYCWFCKAGYYPYYAKITINSHGDINMLLQCANPCPDDSVFIESRQECVRCEFQLFLGCRRCSETQCFQADS